MHVEVTVALNFVISYLYNKLPRRRVDGFGEELERGLKRKFAGHWYPEKPFRGSAFRCLRVSGDEMDPVMERSATKCGLDIEEVREYLPKDLTIWIDPGEVSYRIGEKGAVKILYSNKRADGGEDASTAVDAEVQNANRGFNPEAQSFRPIDSLSSSLTNLSLSPSPSGWPMSNSPTGAPSNPLTSSTSPVTSFLNRNSNATTFTAAAFAATKFGSTKLKCQAKRPSRLSPTEFGAYVKQRSGFQLPSPGQQHPGISNGGYFGAGSVLPGGHGLGSPIQAQHARSLSPRDLRQDVVDQQQHRLFLMQQQQQVFSRQQSPQHQQPQQQQIQAPSGLLLGSSGLLSPSGGSLGDLYHSAPQSAAVSPTSSKLDLFQSPGKGSAPNLQGTPSPTEPNKTFLDSFTWNTLPPYTNLQHLLVAN
ncbi:hypothetical protein LSH36_127g14011 [Paralvinella palmiformis]|uniref:Anti-proliferative protein domain-containing protein n=1 Tax=Paralvinella palmiformis TaxID=53620 RepID=A0AAD9JWY9_9ANNE|nr:hypothetical protein LSH36_127g14011 [Paralvinella palmiformis]